MIVSFHIYERAMMNPAALILSLTAQTSLVFFINSGFRMPMLTFPIDPICHTPFVRNNPRGNLFLPLCVINVYVGTAGQ
jgi:hypothetical protein